MKTFASALALGLFSFVLACGDDSETATSGGDSTSGSGGQDAGSGGDASSPSSSAGNPTSSGQSTSSTASGEGGGGTGAGDTGGGEPAGDYCTARAADRDRFVVVGHPFGEDDYVSDWEVFALSQAGELSQTGKHFEMGIPGDDTQIAFSANGAIGIAVQRDYTLGIFSLDGSGNVTVIDDAAFGPPDFTPNTVTLAPSGDHFIVTDVDFPKIGGGLYRLDIDCGTGEITFAGKVIESKNAYSVVPLGEGRWAVGAVGVDGVESDDVHVVSEGDPWTRDSGANPFDYPDMSPQCMAATQDGQYVVIGDSSIATENHVGLVDVSGETAEVVGEAVQINGPYAIAVSPEGDTAVVAGFKPDALYIVDIGAGGLSLRGEVEYVGGGTQLPGAMAQVTRGSLSGLTLVNEVEGIRVLRMTDGDVTDDGILVFGEQPPYGNYGIGIQP